MRVQRLAVWRFAARLAALILCAEMVLTAAGSARDLYYVDPVVAKNTRVVSAVLSNAGGSIHIPASYGVSGILTYPPNDACAGAAIHLTALGPGGVARVKVDTVFVSGWEPFYVITATFDAGRCQRDRIAFRHAPRLTVIDPHAAKSTTYYMDLAVESGNDAHIPVGPPDESDSRNVTFSFAILPAWALSPNADGVSVPTWPVYRLIIGRQNPG